MSPETIEQVTALLGREPRGLEEVVVAGERDEPVVIRVASLVDGHPFPTLFWLVDPDLCYRIDRLEAAGGISRLQRRIDADSTLRTAMTADHRAHIALRRSYLSEGAAGQLDRLGYLQMLDARGIGGIGNFSRIRCLHTWYAAHLVVPNTVGALVDDQWAVAPCRV
ncbi:MAG: DUF501 domain-containing protein [Halioglobus sp.]|nr:DUF501 domain-containing protein [Halioglobus sp.]